MGTPGVHNPDREELDGGSAQRSNVMLYFGDEHNIIKHGRAEGGCPGTIHLFFVFLLTLLFLVLVLVLLCSLDNGCCDSVQVALTVLANSPATVIGLLEDTDLFQGLADLALDGSGGVCMVRRTVTASVAAAVEFYEFANADVFAKVNMPCDGS